MAIRADALKTYRRALAQYHLHPEGKFLGGDFTDRGVTERRHIAVTAIRHVGKEANKLDEQQTLGLDEAAQIDYGLGYDQAAMELAVLREEADRTSKAAVARRLGVSRQSIWKKLRK